jgi:hypothetical protein
MRTRTRLHCEDMDTSPIPTPDTAQPELEEKIMKARRMGKRPVARDTGEVPVFPSLPEASTISTGIDAQLQTQLAEVILQEQQLLQQIELANASARVVHLKEQLRSISVPFRVREDTQVAEWDEPVSRANRAAPPRLPDATGRVADLQADLERATLQSPRDSQPVSMRERSRAIEERLIYETPLFSSSGGNASKPSCLVWKNKN